MVKPRSFRLQDAYDKFLVVTFVGETRVLAMNEDDELEESEIPGFDADAQTLFCGNVIHDQLVQVTRDGVRLVDATTGQLHVKWHPPAGFQVTKMPSMPCFCFSSKGITAQLSPRPFQHGFGLL